MTATDDLSDAWGFLASGNAAKALRHGWLAAQDALRQGDTAALESIAELADAVAVNSPERHGEEARRLGAYCRHSASGVAGDVESHDLLSRLYRMVRPRRSCTHCSAPLSGSGRFCSNCGQPQS